MLLGRRGQAQSRRKVEGGGPPARRPRALVRVLGPPGWSAHMRSVTGAVVLASRPFMGSGILRLFV